MINASVGAGAVAGGRSFLGVNQAAPSWKLPRFLAQLQPGTGPRQIQLPHPQAVPSQSRLEPQRHAVSGPSGANLRRWGPRGGVGGMKHRILRQIPVLLLISWVTVGAFSLPLWGFKLLIRNQRRLRPVWALFRVFARAEL